MTDPNPRTAHLSRALFADLDYVLGVDPNTLAAFCVRVLDEWDNRVHNHGPEDFFGPGIDCPERFDARGRLRGACMDGAP
jgi:hypothetical protein